MNNYWIIPIACLVLVMGVIFPFTLYEKSIMPPREPEPIIPVVKNVTDSNPYIEFCNPGGFAPDKLIENKTHIFNHHTCVWDKK